MTIKEAFQQLANATKKGMKNPFFIMRSLNKNFSEIADKIEGGGGGGSTVAVDPILTEGTKIATITVDGENNDLYAPAGGGGGDWTYLNSYASGDQIILPATWNEIYAVALISGTHYAIPLTIRKLSQLTFGSDEYIAGALLADNNSASIKFTFSSSYAVAWLYKNNTSSQGTIRVYYK